MYATSVFWLFVVLLCYANKSGALFESDSENVMIETTDITVEYKEGGKIKLMEAYRSTKNDLILRNNKTYEFGQLEWHSIGSPSLSKSLSKNSSLSFANIFHMTPSGFYIYIDMLNEAQKEAFIKKIKSRYNIDVDMTQIIKLKPSKLQCTIELICENENHIVNGSLKAFIDFPLKVEFKALNTTKKCFENYLIEHQHIEIFCTVLKNSKSVKQNYFSLNTEQMSNSDLLDQLFGSGKDEVYVSREQLGSLASEIYSSFNVYEEYEMPEKEFSTSFIEDLIKQTKSHFNLVPFKTALKSLSTYSKKDLNPNEIKSMSEKALKVNTSGGRKHIVTNKLFDNNGSNITNTQHIGSASARDPLFSMLGVDLSYKYVKEKENNWATSNKSLENQLKEINLHSKDYIEWKVDGSRIIPKSLKLSKLVKSSFKNGLKFERIKKIVANTIVRKNFLLEYKDDNKIKYHLIPNEMVNSTSLRGFKTIRIKSILDCLNECETLINCHYIEQVMDKSECHIYNKNAILHLVPTKATKTYLYKKLISSSNKEFSGYLITGNHLKKIRNSRDKETCWMHCINELECESISFGLVNSDCLLFKNGENYIEYDDNFVSVTNAKNDLLSNINLKRFEGMKLINHFKSFATSLKEAACWKECLKTEGCQAISYRSNWCYLYRDNNFQVVRQSGWITIAFRNENLDKKYSISYEETRMIASAIELCDADSMFSCWSKCFTTNECIAISYGGENLCHLLSKGYDYRSERESGWVSISLEEKESENVYSKRYEKTQISGFFMYLNLDSEYLCWCECLKRDECIAVSFGDNRCHLVKKGEYQLRSYDNWVSIYLEDESPIEMQEDVNFNIFSNMSNSGAVHALAILENGDLVSGSCYPTMKIWNSSNGLLKHEVQNHGRSVKTLLVLHNGDFVSGGFNKELKIWSNGEMKANLSGHSDMILCLASFPNSDFASGSSDNTIIVWTSDGESKITLKNHTNSVCSLTVLPNGDLASGSADASINIWDISDGSVKLKLYGHTSDVISLVALNNGFLASSSLNEIKIWNENGEVVKTFDEKIVHVLALYNNGYLISGSGNGTIKIRNVYEIVSESAENLDESKEVKSTLIVNGLIRSLAIFSNGDFACGTEEGEIILWKRN